MIHFDLRNKIGSMPSVGQVVLAALLGVLLGVLITQLGRLKENRWAIRQVIADAQKAASLQASKLNMPSVNIGPSLDRRMIVLLMGVDSNGRNTQRWVNTRSDTMILVSIDPRTSKVGMVSVPRDSRVPIPGHSTDKINSAHALGGPDLAVETVRQNFNVPIDHYVVIDADGLKKLFQVLGPVQVVVEKKMHYNDWAGHLHVALDSGMQTLTPEQAEEYVRFRHDAQGDIGRIQRQQWFLRQVSQKLKEPQILLKLPQLFQLANEYVVTDLSVEDMAKLANFGRGIKPSQVETATLPGHAETISGGSYWIPDMDGSGVVLNRLLGTPINIAQNDETSGSPNSAYAATTPDIAPLPGLSDNVTFNIRYPKGAEQAAKNFEAALIQAGYKVRARIQSPLSDCQHEQIVQTSYRANEIIVDKVRSAVANLADFPVAINPDQHASVDLVVVITNQTVPPQVDASAVTAAQWSEDFPQPDVDRPHKRNRRHKRTNNGSTAETPNSETSGSAGSNTAQDAAGSTGSTGSESPQMQSGQRESSQSQSTPSESAPASQPATAPAQAESSPQPPPPESKPVSEGN